MGALIEAVRLVDNILAEENEVLRRHDARGAAALQERKVAATRLYHERMRTMAQTPATRSIGPEQRAQLVEMARGLDERVRENAILLKATIVSIDRLFAAINQAVQMKVKREVSYSRAGVVAASTQPGSASVAFNREV